MWKHDLGVYRDLRNNLKLKAEGLAVAKYGNIEDLKQRLLGFWMSRTSKKVEEQLASLAPSTAQPAKPEGVAPSEPPLKSVETNGAADGADLPKEPGNSADPANLTLFGRSTFALKPADCDDRTGFFANIDEGPEVKADQKESYIELFETGLDGVVPVAGLVKILQGFQEEQQNQVAILLASL